MSGRAAFMTAGRLTDEMLQTLQDRYLPALVVLEADKVRTQEYGSVQVFFSSYSLS